MIFSVGVPDVANSVTTELNSLDYKASARAATTTTLPAYTASGTGVGKTLTGSSNGALAAQDGITLAAGERLLVKNETGGSQKNNGIYTVTVLGTAGTPYVLTRATDFDSDADVTSGAWVEIEEGSTLAGTAWVVTTANPITLDTTALTFTQFGRTTANPSASIGLSVVNGTAETVMRSDGAPALSQAITPTWTGAHIWSGVTGTGRRDSIGTTSTDAWVLENTTAAAAGAQQYSPRLRFKGYGWKTDATAASQAVEWTIEAHPIQGSVNPTVRLDFSAAVNGGAFSQKMWVDNAGNLNCGGTLSCNDLAPGTFLAIQYGGHGANTAYGGLDALTIASASVASATPDLSASTGRYVSITGTTAITALGTMTAGIERVLVFAGALTFTHNGTSLILPGAANITTAAGDVAWMVSLGSGNWRCLSYVKTSGLAAINYWSRSGTTITPATAGDTLSSPGAGASSERFGASATAAGASTAVFGNGASAGNQYSVAVGASASCSTADESVAIGYSADNSGGASYQVAIGAHSGTTANGGVAIGWTASGAGLAAVAIGMQASIGSSGYQYSVAIGYQATAAGSYHVAVGGATNIPVSGSGNTVVGYAATISGARTNTICVGYGTQSANSYCVVLGAADGTNQTSADNQCLIGAKTGGITSVFVGNGVTHASPAAISFQPTGASGTNVAGVALNFYGGRNTGNVDGGDIIFNHYDAGGSGTGQGTAREVARVGVDGLELTAAASGSGAQIVKIGQSTGGLITKMATNTISPSAIETAVFTVPKGSVIRSVNANCQSALTGGGTTVTWSIGTAATPDKYGTAGYPTPANALTQNSKSNWIGATQITTTDEAVILTGAATGGTADGDTALTAGSVKIIIIYDTYESMPNA